MGRMALRCVLAGSAVLFANAASAEQIYLHCIWASPPGVRGEAIDFLIDTESATITNPANGVHGRTIDDHWITTLGAHRSL